MFKAVQKRMIETMEVQKAFLVLDTNGFGFLTLRDLQINLSKHIKTLMTSPDASLKSIF